MEGTEGAGVERGDWEEGWGGNGRMRGARFCKTHSGRIDVL